MKIFYTFLILSFFGIQMKAQPSKLNFELKSMVKQMSPDQNIQLFLRGDNAGVKEFVLKNKGTIKYELKNIVAVSIPVSAIDLINNEVAIKYVEFSKNRVAPLNDTMLINNNIVPIHDGQSPLPQAFTGKDIVIGFIDTGIDQTHPDFHNVDSTSRIKFIWDQNQSTTDTANGGGPARIPYGFTYGQEWTDTDYNNGIIGHTDPYEFYGHGTNVASVAAGNGLATGNYKGVAPDADIVMVALNFYSENGLMLTADAANYIYKKADEMQKPCVINCSEGDYYGSHDGLDAAALIIDSLVGAKRGRAFICAAGNSGTLDDYHLRNNVTTDTSFTFFKYNPNSALGYGAVFFEIWADTADFNNINFSVGADKILPSHEFRGYIPFKNISQNINTLTTDTLKNTDGNILAIVDIWAGLRGGQYQLQIHIAEPDSNQYHFRFAATGSGSYDVWSQAYLFGTSDIVKDAASIDGFLDLGHYIEPDNKQSIVSSWACSPNIITVGNYNNRNMFLNADTVGSGITTNPFPAGEIVRGSSRGPNRNNLEKPDISASGDFTLAAGSLEIINIQLSVAQFDKVAADRMHNRNGGTSMACPVVGGIAALYFGKCSNASQVEIMEAIVNTAITDNYADSLPGLQWGNGKANGFAALNYFNELATLSPPDSVQGCAGEVSIAVNPNFETVIWNNGDSTNLIFPQDSGLYFATVFTTSNCNFFTDTISAIIYHHPPIPIIDGSSDFLDTQNEGIVSFQWYIDGIAIDGATDSTHYADTSGDYTVEVENIFGCSSISAPFEYWIIGLEESEASNQIQLFPMPAEDALNIKMNLETVLPIDLVLYDNLGRIVFKEDNIQNKKSNIQQISTRDFTRGTYFLEIKNDDFCIVKKIILI